jgi:hypothetical protein
VREAAVKKIVFLGGIAAAVLSASKRRKAGAKAHSAKLWSDAVNPPTPS